METTSVIGTKNNKNQVYTDPRVMLNEAPRTPSFFTGSEVIKEAVRRANVDVMVAYPITPQSEAAALCGELFAEGYVKEYFRGESEFAVMSQCAGAAFGGARVFTTTAGPGTMRAMENFPMGAGARLPIQMIVTCRGMSASNSPAKYDVPRHQFPALNSARHHRNFIPASDRHAGLARRDGAGLL